MEMDERYKIFRRGDPSSAFINFLLLNFPFHQISVVPKLVADVMNTVDFILRSSEFVIIRRDFRQEKNGRSLTNVNIAAFNPMVEGGTDCSI